MKPSKDTVFFSQVAQEIFDVKIDTVGLEEVLVDWWLEAFRRIQAQGVSLSFEQVRHVIVAWHQSIREVSGQHVLSSQQVTEGWVAENIDNLAWDVIERLE